MRLILAPMEGLVNGIMRDILTRIGGIDLCVAEFLRADGNLLPPRIFLATVPELVNGGCTPAGVPVRVQLLGHDPVVLAENAARAAELGAPGIDLNFGCPAPTVNRHGAGAALLAQPERLHAIVAAVRRAVPEGLPVTAKMRLGLNDTALTLDCARALQAGGADELTVHARTRAEAFRPPAHWEWIARIREAVAIPVIANGDVWNRRDWEKIREVSGCADVMLGRGLVARPDLARSIRHSTQAMPWEALLPWLREYFERMYAAAPKSAHGFLKQWLNMLRGGFPEAEELYRKVRTENDPQRLEALLGR
ncbi:MAG: tRNA-dihydrouridine synthase family protein [Sulfuricella sp.]|nr:tRNA-dihydrouridine synthase family protein [Sulfuricella sp.]